MNKVIFLTVLLLIPLTVSAGEDYKKMVSNLKKIKGGAPLSEEPLFLDVINGGLDIVPYLIDGVGSKRKSKVGVIGERRDNFRVGDLALAAIFEIVDVPLSEISGILPSEGNDRWRKFWNHLHWDASYRRELQRELGRWWEENKEELYLVEIAEPLPGFPSGYYRTDYRAPVFEPAEEDIFIDYLLPETDYSTGAKYLERKRPLVRRKYTFELHEWQRSGRLTDEDEKILERILPEMKEYADSLTEGGFWDGEVPRLGQKRYGKFKVVPHEDYWDYLMGENGHLAGPVYRITRPVYDKSGEYVMIHMSWIPIRGTHGRGSSDIILRKVGGKWTFFRYGVRIIS